MATQNQSIERHYPAISICPLKVTGGIYGIINNSSGKIYVGSAVSFRKRWNGHKHFFRRGIQENQYLQRAFDKKPHEFEIFIIEELKNLSKENLLSREQFWMDFYKSYIPSNGYNLSPKAGSCLGIKMAEEVRLAMSKRLKGRKLTPEWRHNISNGLRGRPRKPFTEEHKANIRAASARRIVGKDLFSRMGKKAALLKMRWRPVIQLDVNGNEIKRYDSIKLAASSLGFLGSRFNIGDVCRGERPLALGYKWKYAN